MSSAQNKKAVCALLLASSLFTAAAAWAQGPRSSPIPTVSSEDLWRRLQEQYRPAKDGVIVDAMVKARKIAEFRRKGPTAKPARKEKRPLTHVAPVVDPLMDVAPLVPTWNAGAVSP